MSFNRKGFVLCKSQGAPYTQTTFKVVATANNAYYINDPVKLEGATGLAERVTASSSTLLGIIKAPYSNSNGQKRPLTHSLPTNGAYLTSGKAGFVEVITDPRARFIAALDTSASAGLIGRYIGVTAGAPNASSGLSGYGLKASTVTAVNNRPFQIVDISDFEKAVYGRNTDIAGDAGVVVKLANALIS